MKRKFSMAMVALLIVVGVGYVACAEMFPSGTWRYKMTVTVETPEGLKSGSAVREVTVKRIPKILPESHASKISLRGEAVAIDLGHRGILFATLIGAAHGADYASDIIFDAFPVPGFKPGTGGASNDGIEYYKHLKGVEKTLEPAQYPLFVSFGDLKKPQTVQKVFEVQLDPSQLYNPNPKVMKVMNEMEAIFGKSVRLHEVKVEMTDAPITVGIEKSLEWLPQFYNKRFDGSRFTNVYSSNKTANILSSGAFSTEVPKK